MSFGRMGSMGRGFGRMGGAARSGPLTVGGAVVGAAGTSGIYVGSTLSWGDDFSSLSLVGPTSPKGKYSTSRAYAINGGPSMPQRQKTGVTHLTDPLYTGYLDSNRGVPVGFNNIRVAGSVLTIQARAATAAEKLNLADPVANTTIGVSMASTGAFVFCPGTGAANIIEMRARWLPAVGGVPAGFSGGIWTFSASPVEATANMDEIDIVEGYSDHMTSNYHAWTGGSAVADAAANYSTADFFDGNYHLISCVASKDSILYYVDGVLKRTLVVDGNSRSKPSYILFQAKAITGTQGGVTFDQAAWDAAGTSDTSGAHLDIDWVRGWRPSTASHRKPLLTVPDLNVGYLGTGTIVIPSAATLWPDAASVTEFVQITPFEANEPGVTETTSYTTFPTGISYDAPSRTISVDFSAQGGSAGCCHGAVYATKVDGSTCEPALFTINRGPHITTTATLGATNGAPFSHDFYAECDVGIITPKVISFTGALPAGLTFDGVSTISGTPTVTADTVLTINCTNSAGQTATKGLTISVTANVTSAFQSTAQDLTAQTNYSFASLAIGAASAGRYVLVGIDIRAGAARTISSVTIGGVSATSVGNVANGNTTLGFWIALVPTGTTATVAVNLSGAAARAWVSVWSVVGLSSTTATATASDIALSGTGPVVYSTTINIAAGGSCFAVAYWAQTGETDVWAGLTLAADGGLTGVATATSASQDFATVQTGRTISVTASPGTTVTDVGGMLVVAML